ncbi:MAG: hypothetical protein GXO91_07665 [FCB group bacterium]|nr:hypothetical protein [FCB group bacterium]
MPVFEYKCQSCGKIFSAFVPSHSTPDSAVKCSACNKHHAERILSLKASIATGPAPKGCSAPAGSGFS